jgi:hypothetical protein
MKAARLYEVGTSLKIAEVAEPTSKPGGEIVKVLASHVPNSMSGIDVFTSCTRGSTADDSSWDIIDVLLADRHKGIYSQDSHNLSLQ